MCGSDDDHSSELHELLGEWFELCNSNHPRQRRWGCNEAMALSLETLRLPEKLWSKTRQLVRCAVARHHLISTPCRSARIEKRCRGKI